MLTGPEASLRDRTRQQRRARHEPDLRFLPAAVDDHYNLLAPLLEMAT